MADIKMLTLVNSLLEKTRAGKIAWAKTTSDAAFLVQLSDLAVGVRKVPTGVIIDILDSSGAIVESATAMELQSLALTQPVLSRCEELYSAAKSSATGSERVLNSLLSTLERL